MANLSKQQRADLYKSYAEIYGIVATNTADALKTAGEESLWMIMGLDIFLVCGDVGPDNEILFAQRQEINNLFKENGFFDLIRKNIKIPIVDIKIPNPLRPMINIIWPYGKALRKTAYDDEGIGYFVGLDPISRATLAIAIPGIMRLFLKLMPQIIGGVIPG